MTWLRTLLALITGWWIARRRDAAYDAKVQNEITQKIAVAEADAPRDGDELHRRLRDGTF